jgi:Resolvase, N terminal domain/Recombinase/Recombinase zinc beta ribbon domain
MSNPAPSEVPKAYSYRRFSTPEQAKGDSLHRQTTMAREWADRHSVPLDMELDLTDKGISAYLGANAETGALGVFLAAVRDGTIPRGSWLLVESLDRVSRQVVRKAARTIEDIVDAGITLVDLSDGAREYSAEALDSDPTLFLMMALRFMRANEESALKGSRVARAYRSKRESFAGSQALDKPYTRRLPAWMRWDDDTKQYSIIEERGALVREMFERTDAGEGQHKIARDFNARGLETWGAGGWKAKYWHRSYIRKILSNRATVGVFTPHLSAKDPRTRRRTRTPQKTIDHRLPAVVDRELFERVKSRLDTTAARGRNSSREPRSIFAGVLKCQYCDGTVTRVTKGKHVYLVCSAANARGGTCKYESIPYQQAEDTFCLAIDGIIMDAPRGRDTGDLEEAIRDAQNIESVRSDEMGELLELLIVDRSRAARDRLKAVEAQMEEARHKASELNKKLDSMTSASVQRKFDAINSVLRQPPRNIAEANRVLKQAIRKMVFDPARGAIEIHWHHADEPQQTGGLVTNRGPFPLGHRDLATTEHLKIRKRAEER